MTAYLGKCKKCAHATHATDADVQILDSGRKVTLAATGEKVLVGLDGRIYDRTQPYNLNGVAVAARCPEHGPYRLNYVKGKLKPGATPQKRPHLSRPNALRGYAAT
jgi:hypothetical protein